MVVDMSKVSEVDIEAGALRFRALSDPTRLRILCFLRECGPMVSVDDAGECRTVGGPNGATVGDVCCRFEQSQSTISHHLRELRIAGLVRMERSGRQVFCSVNEDALAELGGFLVGVGRHPDAACSHGSPAACTHEAVAATAGRGNKG